MAFGGTQASFRAQYQPAVVNGYSSGGTIYGIPHEVSSFAFWVNGEQFKAAGLDPVKDFPKTWSDVSRIGKKLTTAKTEGIVMPLYNPVRDTMILDTMARQAGQGLFSDDGKTARLNSAAAVKALQTWGDFIHKDKINDPKLGPTAATDSLDLFGNGTAAMNPAGGSWFTSILEQQYPNVYKNYTVGQYPTMDGGRPIGANLYGFGLFVSKGSQNQAETWKFARFLADSGETYFKEGGLWLGDLKTLNGAATRDFPKWDVFKTAFSRGFFLPPVVAYNELSQIIERAIQRVVLTGQSAKASLDQAQQEAAPLMK
jgi:multiple sugar transport system substrate-binding protein